MGVLSIGTLPIIRPKKELLTILSTLKEHLELFSLNRLVKNHGGPIQDTRTEVEKLRSELHWARELFRLSQEDLKEARKELATLKKELPFAHLIA